MRGEGEPVGNVAQGCIQDHVCQEQDADFQLALTLQRGDQSVDIQKTEQQNKRKRKAPGTALITKFFGGSRS